MENNEPEPIRKTFLDRLEIDVKIGGTIFLDLTIDNDMFMDLPPSVQKELVIHASKQGIEFQ